ncbi:MAG: hypothetical protein IIT68_05060 [Treponema sp.]|nr:hypothetical protein [Treponema sp.]
MKVTKQTYANMNKAYNTLFDEWQNNIEGMPAEVDKQLNMAMVLLDGVLDKLKVAMEETLAAEQNASDSGSDVQTEQEKPAHKGFKIFGGK